MNIKFEKCSDHYRADCVDLPGSPPVGFGTTKERALACLMWQMIFSPIGDPMDNRKWIDIIKKEDPIIVDGTKWEYPESYKRNGR